MDVAGEPFTERSPASTPATPVEKTTWMLGSAVRTADFGGFALATLGDCGPFTIWNVSLTTPVARTLVSVSVFDVTSRRQEPWIVSEKYMTGWSRVPPVAAPP